jgi:hypothetical protein
MFFVNRVIFLALLGFLAVVGYIWKRYKPEGWELQEFVYHPGTAQDAPDDPLTLSGNGMFSMTYTPSPQMREPEDLERYREFIGYMSALEKMKEEGVVRPELSTERKELLMRRPGYPFYPRRRSLLTLKTLATSVIAFLILVLIVMSSA